MHKSHVQVAAPKDNVEDVKTAVPLDEGRTNLNSSRGRLNASAPTASAGAHTALGRVKVKNGKAGLSTFRALSSADKKMALTSVDFEVQRDAGEEYCGSGSSTSIGTTEESGEGLNFGCTVFLDDASANSWLGEAKLPEKVDVALKLGMGSV